MSNAEREGQFREAFVQQAKWCRQLGSPLTGLLMDCLAHSLDHKTQTGRTVLSWSGHFDAMGDAVPLRLAGALHALVRRGRLPGLAAHYPPAPLADPDVFQEAVCAAIVEADEEILPWLEFAPQTNEVARSAVLQAGLSLIAEETRLPLALFELGASAGLNLFADRYSYDLNGTAFGETGSAVQLSPLWQGPDPSSYRYHVASRRGCDRNPLDVSDPGHRERLISYVWPDQPERFQRVEAAIDIARAEPPHLDKADAADWVEEMFNAPPERGRARVLFHTIAYQYFDADSKARIETKMEEAGAQASDDAPLAWLSFEQFEQDGPRLTLQQWPDRTQRVLAHADAHCRSIMWAG